MNKAFTLALLFLLTACIRYSYGPMPGDEKYLLAAKNVPTAEEAVYVAEANLYLRKRAYNPFLGSKYDLWTGILFVTPKSLVFMNVYERTGRFIEFFKIYYSEIEKMNAGPHELYPTIFGPDNPISVQEYPIIFDSMANSAGQEVSFDEIKEYVKMKISEQQK